MATIQRQPASPSSIIENLSKTLQVISVVIGLVITVLSYNNTRNLESEKIIAEQKKYADERKDISERQRIEAAKPFLEIRQKAYLDAVKTAAIIANPETHSPEDVKKAKMRFRELYVAELGMVESSEVSAQMVQLAHAVDPALTDMTQPQKAALELSHALRNSLVKSWRVDSDTVIGMQ